MITRTRGPSCSSRTTARRRRSCPRPTRSSPETRSAGPRICGPRRAAATQIVGYVGDNEHDEAQFVGKEIDALVDAGDAVFGDVAVFYRTNSASRALEDVFIRTGMPYRIVGGVRFYERKEVKDALAYLRAIANPDDEINLRRILNTPARGIGDRAEATVAVFAERERIGFGEALQRIKEVPGSRPGPPIRWNRSPSCWPDCARRSASGWNRPTC